jgi:phosphoglycolate phosphatase
MNVLALFDIDGTLLHTGGAGKMAMERAGRHLYHSGFSVEGVEFTGRLDSEVWRELAQRYGVSDTKANLGAFIAAYTRELKESAWESKQCPGVSNLLHLLAEDAHVTVGILTGNFRDTGLMKLRKAGLEPEQFSVCAWGEEATTRPGLVPVALLRWRSGNNGISGPNKTLIIGDSPRDVECALATGSACVAVATGSSSTAELKKAGAHLAIESFSDSDALFQFIEAL